MVKRRELTVSMAEKLLAELEQHPIFHRHSERVAALTLKICAAHHLIVDEETIRWAARFHDIMVLRPFRHAPWSSTYVEESAELARVWLAERSDLDPARIQLAVDCIRHHHDVRRHANPVVDAFRRADWSEVSGGLLTGGLPRSELTALQTVHSARGFWRALGRLLLRFTIRPINFIRIFWPHRH
jgi:HD domain-containing protein